MSKAINECVPWVVYSISDLRGFWFPLDHGEWPGVELFELAPIDLRGVGVEIGMGDVEEVVNPILGVKALLVELSSAFNAVVMLLELSDVPSVFWSCACRLGEGSKGAARLDKVEVVVLPVAVGLGQLGVGLACCWCNGRKICTGFCI